MTYILKRRLTSPRNYMADTLFEFCVNKLGQRSFPDSVMTHNQWASLIFGIGNSTNQMYLSKVTKEYSRYLRFQGKKYSWNFPLIYKDFPDFFVTAQKGAIEVREKRDFFGELLDALQDEKTASKKDRKNHTYKVQQIVPYNLNSGKQVYAAYLDLEEDEEPKLFEELPIQLKIGGINIDTKVLDYDHLQAILFFDYAQKLDHYYGDIRVVVDATWILDKISEHINDFKEIGYENTIIKQFIDGKFSINKLESRPSSTSYSMDESQIQAFEKSIQQNISLIWGPPGTGKSHTLGYILKALFSKKEEKTLVCCIANVAVDALTEKLVDTLTKYAVHVPQGKILRLGHTRSQRLLATDYLFPNSPLINQLRAEIEKLDISIRNSKQQREIITLKQELSAKRTALAEAIKQMIAESNIIFCTASKYYIDQQLSEMSFDNLIIDEASMMSVPHFVALAKYIKKRIIVAGDFRQLGPVVLSQTAMAKKWLN